MAVIHVIPSLAAVHAGPSIVLPWMEGGFDDMLTFAQQASPIDLRQWYRTWVVAAQYCLAGSLPASASNVAATALD